MSHLRPTRHVSVGSRLPLRDELAFLVRRIRFDWAFASTLLIVGFVAGCYFTVGAAFVWSLFL
jgi:hypothetical protein